MTSNPNSPPQPSFLRGCLNLESVRLRMGRGLGVRAIGALLKPPTKTTKRKGNMTYDNGETKWQHGQVVEWHENRNPRRWLLGPCPRCGSVTSNYGSAFSCHGDYCPNSASMFVCSPEPTPEWWNKGINVKRDGGMWCATKEDFINLQESSAGFGKTPNEAVEDLNACILREKVK